MTNTVDHAGEVRKKRCKLQLLLQICLKPSMCLEPLAAKISPSLHVLVLLNCAAMNSYWRIGLQEILFFWGVNPGRFQGHNDCRWAFKSGPGALTITNQWSSTIFHVPRTIQVNLTRSWLARSRIHNRHIVGPQSGACFVWDSGDLVLNGSHHGKQRKQKGCWS